MPKKNVPDPGNVGPESGSDKTQGTEDAPQEEPSWTRGNDPEAAAEALRQANRGSTGGELNMPVPKHTPQG